MDRSRTTDGGRTILAACVSAVLGVSASIVISAPMATPRAGALDPTFGTNGLVTTDVFGGFGDRAVDVAVGADGAIIAAGSWGSQASRYNFAIAKYRADGALDPGFGSAGRVLLDFDGDDDYGGALAIQPDGRFVVAGSAELGGRPSDFGIARFLPGGALDASFAGNGKQATDFGGSDAIATIAIQSDGKIVAAGWTERGGEIVPATSPSPATTPTARWTGHLPQTAP